MTESIQKSPSFLKPVLIGAMIGLVLMSLFLLGVDNPDPNWGPYWQIRPLILISFAGATGGAVFYFMLRQQYTGFRKPLALFVSAIIYCIGLWIGSVLGLVGTLWN